MLKSADKITKTPANKEDFYKYMEELSPLPKEEAQEIYNQWQESHFDYDNRQYTYEEIPSNILILYDHYTYEDYSGYGHVICYDTEKDSFFEVFGSHCSCYGLEGQWEPEYCTIEEMVHAAIVSGPYLHVSENILPNIFEIACLRTYFVFIIILLIEFYSYTSCLYYTQYKHEV